MICLKITSTLQPQFKTVLFAVENDSNRCSKCLLSHNFYFTIKYDLAAIRAWEKRYIFASHLGKTAAAQTDAHRLPQYFQPVANLFNS